MWLKFLTSFNGVSMFHDSFWTFNSNICLHTYSSAAIGHSFGATFVNQWAMGVWPKQWHDSGLTTYITLLEYFPLLVSLHIQGDNLRNKKVLFKCDNQAVVNIVNSQTCKSDKVMVLVRAFTLQCLRLNIIFKAEHLPTLKTQLQTACLVCRWKDSGVQPQKQNKSLFGASSASMFKLADGQHIS